MLYRIKRINGNVRIAFMSEHGPVELKPRWSQRVFNHSPDGFEMGYGGSGPAQSGLAILLHYLSRQQRDGVRLCRHDVESIAVDRHNEFTRRFVARNDRSVRIFDREIRDFLGEI